MSPRWAPPLTPEVPPSGDPRRLTADRLAGLARRPWVPPVLAVTILLALLAVIFYRQLFAYWTFPWDFVGAYSASPAFVGASIGHGLFLSWMPHVASGFPVALDPQSGIYFPLWWLLGALRVPLTLGVLTAVQVAHVLFGSVGVLALARVRGLRWRWASVAAVAYLFFGGFYGEAEHADIFRGFAYIPWLLWSLTPPEAGRRWTQVAAVPLVTWLIASGAYPGQLVSYGLTGVVYVAVALRVDARDRWRSLALPLGLAAVSSVAVCAAVLLPFLHAQSAHELVRIYQPTAATRAGESLTVEDFLGLYLNNFAWAFDGTVTAWAVGVPILIGLACARRPGLRRHAPLVACGGVALALAMLPKIGFVGKAMTSLSLLFPSRFPAADYKAVVAIAAILVATQSWADIAGGCTRPIRRPAAMACVLILGVLFAPSTFGPASRAGWLVIAVCVASLALAWARPPAWIFAIALALLIGVDGAREVVDYRQLGHQSPWAASPAQAAPYRARNPFVRGLPIRLEHPPASRPARIGPAAPLATSPTGNDPDAAGWTGDGYHSNDYGGTIERKLWDAEHDVAWSRVLLAPWHAYTFSCSGATCRDPTRRLPAADTWKVSSDVRTTSYGAQGIVYDVHVRRPELMVENELAIPGWHTASRRVSLVPTNLPFRVWRLSPGDYQFAATFRQPGQGTQLSAAVLALLAWFGCLAVLTRRRVAGARPRS